MDLARIESELCHVADVMVVDARTLRHLIKQHRRVTGVVPHGRCYAITRSDLEQLEARQELPVRHHAGRPWLLLVARPSPRQLRRFSPAQLHQHVLRAAFHASVHRALEMRRLTPRELRTRIEQIGRTEFEEFRAIFAHDDLLLPPATDLEVYIEFCAVYLELAWFAPELLETTFPGLADHSRAELTILDDVDAASLLAANVPAPGFVSSRAGVASILPPAPTATEMVEPKEQDRLLIAAERAAERRDHARAALLAARATRTGDARLRRRAHESLDRAAQCLAERLRLALEQPASASHEAAEDPWVHAISRLALKAFEQRRRSSVRPEAKTLRHLQRAAAAHEQPGVIVDLPSWLLSRGRRSIVRPRDAMRQLQVMQFVRRAVEQAERAPFAALDRTRVVGLLQNSAERAEHLMRRALRPKILGVLRQVGLSAESGPEQHSRSQLVEELLDRVVDQGYLSLSQLRDAISRNEIKLRDLSGRAELVSGDPVLLADEQLELALDGIYRRGDIYLRLLQKLSSLPFGTRLGRIITLYLALPLIGSFVVLEGIRYGASALFLWLGLPPVELLNWKSFFITTGVLFGILHSEGFRIFARQLLETVGVVLAWVFFRIPRAILTRPAVQRLLARPTVRGLIRRVLLPTMLGAVAYFVLPSPEDESLRALAAFTIFAFSSALFASPFGFWIENLAFDHLAPTWHTLSRHWIPQALRLIGRTFRTLMDALERWINWIDDALRFRKSRSKALLALAGIAGAVWAVVGYVIRLYITLLVEPELNPLKHFPVVTVAHKVLLPFTPDLLRAFDRAFSLFGDLVGGAAAGVTVFLLPSVFGFLVWELKENYRLYRATRSRYVVSARLGPGGETMHGLLIPGLHSGTLPKLYERLRRAAQRHDVSRPTSRTKAREALGADVELRRFRQGLFAVERSLRHFVQRELLPALASSCRDALGELSIERIELSSNRIRIRLRCSAFPDASCELAFEQLGGLIVAGLSDPGFAALLGEEQALLFENALAVFYHRAQVDLVREQIEGELPERAHYEIVERQLNVWIEDDYDAKASYGLAAYRPRRLTPKAAGSVPEGLSPLDSRRVIFSHQRIPWSAWEHAWSRAARGAHDIPRLLAGPSLLPKSTEEPTVFATA